ncbi:hypothetical protein ACFL35_07505 [Candidatus Riflebacteria bacterium]
MNEPDLTFFINAGKLEDFSALSPYQGLSTENMVQKLRTDWRDICIAEIEKKSQYLQETETSAENEVDFELEKLDEIKVEKDGVCFFINGVIHGMIGGGTKKYRDLIHRTLSSSEEQLLFEAGFNHLYGSKKLKYANIPCFSVLGLIDSIKKGLHAGILLPLLLWEVVKEFFSAMPEDTPYHSLDQEIRRGIEGVLPTPLEVEWDLSKDKPLLSFEDYPNIVRRSAYMAAFAEKFCEKNSITSCRLVVGDFHLTEIAYFFNNPELIPKDLLTLADRTTNSSTRIQGLLYLKENLLHNFIAGLAGFVSMLPYIILWVLLQNYFLGR